MKIIITSILSLTMLTTIAQEKKFYLGCEIGSPVSNVNGGLVNGMHASHLDEKSYFIFLGLEGSFDYPDKKSGKSSYRIRAGLKLNPTKAIEVSFGRSSEGSVTGYDFRESSNTGYYLFVDQEVHTLSVIYVLSDSLGKVGIGLGPALNFFKFRHQDQYHTTLRKDNPVSPGICIQAFWNFVSQKSWYLGLIIDGNLGTGGRIKELKLTNPYTTEFATFRERNVGTINGIVGLRGGIRFNQK